MSIHFISGKPGGGKSLYATKLIFEELLFTDRTIVTNLALNVGRLNEYYQQNYDKPVLKFWRIRIPSWLRWMFFWLPEWVLHKVFPVDPVYAEESLKKPRRDDICSRIILLTEEQIGTFFCTRPGSTIEHIENVDWQKGKRPDYSVVKDGGVLFVIDEVHIGFNSREWARTGAEVIYYLSQHRKLGDDVLAITQSVGNVDKQFRSVAQDFTYIRNLGKETWGKFRLPLRFIRKTYQQPATDTSKPDDTGSFSLDVEGIASCYDTAKGVGIHGRAGADSKERRKGIHWIWFVVGTPALIIAIVHFGPLLIAKMFKTSPRIKATLQPSQAASSSLVVPLPERLQRPSGTGSGSQRGSEVSNFQEIQPVPKPEPTITGIALVDKVYYLILSDRRTIDSKRGRISRIVPEQYAIIDGKRYEFGPAPETAEPLNLPVVTVPQVEQKATVATSPGELQRSADPVQFQTPVFYHVVSQGLKVNSDGQWQHHPSEDLGNIKAR